MDMKAFRADLQQKSFNARKTNNYEDRINVTYKGMVSENSEEYYKELSENLEKSVNFLSGLLRAAEYQSINVGIQNALRGRSNNLNEMAAPPATPGYIATPTVNPLPDHFRVDPRPGHPGSHQQGPKAPIRGDDPFHLPSGQTTYTTPNGYTYTWNPNAVPTGRWELTGKPPQIRPAPRKPPTVRSPANVERGRSNNLNEMAAPPATPAPAPAPVAPFQFGFTVPQEPASNQPTGGPPSNPSPGDTYTTPDGTTLVWENGRWKVVTYVPTTPKPAPAPAPAPAPRSPNTPPQNNPDDPLQPGERWTGKDGTTWQWNGTKWKIISRAPAPRAPNTPRKGGGSYPGRS